MPPDVSAHARTTRGPTVALLALALLLWGTTAAWAQTSADRPLATPPALQPGRPDPERGVQIDLGVHSLRLRADEPDVDIPPGPAFSDGALLGVELVRPTWRVAYARRLYRHELPDGAVFNGTAVDFLSMESDQAWGFYGIRPLRTLYLGAGLGVAHRRLRFSAPGSSTATAETAQETRTLVGLMADWAVFLPFSLQLRSERDTGDGLVNLDVTTFALSFHVPY